MGRGFTISVSNHDERVGFLGAEDDRWTLVPLERATRFAFEDSAQSHADFLKKEGVLGEGVTLSVCNADGWPPLPPIDTTRLSRSIENVTAILEACS